MLIQIKQLGLIALEIQVTMQIAGWAHERNTDTPAPLESICFVRAGNCLWWEETPCCLLSFTVEPYFLAQEKWDAGSDEFGDLTHIIRTKLFHLVQTDFTIQHFVNIASVIKPNGMIPVIPEILLSSLPSTPIRIHFEWKILQNVHIFVIHSM